MLCTASGVAGGAAVVVPPGMNVVLALVTNTEILNLHLQMKDISEWRGRLTAESAAQSLYTMWDLAHSTSTTRRIYGTAPRPHAGLPLGPAKPSRPWPSPGALREACFMSTTTCILPARRDRVAQRAPGWGPPPSSHWTPCWHDLSPRIP